MKYKYRVISGSGLADGETCSEWNSRREARTAAAKLILAGFPYIEIRRGCFLLDTFTSRHPRRRLYAAVQRKRDTSVA